MDIDIMAVMECAEYVMDKMDKRYFYMLRISTRLIFLFY